MSGFGQQFGDKGDAPHYFHDTHATMMIRKFYVELVMHAPMWTLKHQVCGHVTLGLRIHFSYLSQPSASKICSFINSCIHSSPFWAFGKTFTAFTLQVYTYFFNKTFCVLIGESFSKKELEFISFRKHLGFLIKNIFFLF